MRVQRAALILLLIVLRPILLAVLWPLVAVVRFITFGSPLVLLFLVVILFHTADAVQRSFAWSLIASMAGFVLVSARLRALQRKLREDSTLWFGRRAAIQGQMRPYQGRDFKPEPGTTAGIQSYPRSLPHMRQR